MDQVVGLEGKRIKGQKIVLEFLFYQPVLRGFILLIVSGFTFPLCGIFILRMNLLPIRFLLMHGVILGGAIGLTLNYDVSLCSLAVNIAIILFLGKSSKITDADYGQLTMFFMIISIAAASVIISVFNIPAKDTLTLLWGSLYITDMRALLSAGFLAVILVFYSILNFRQLTAYFYNTDVAKAMNINTSFLEYTIILLIALVVAAAMRLMGALLLDALILLPVIVSGIMVSSLKKMMIFSCFLGGIFSITGFFISLYFDIPVSSGVAVPGAAAFLITMILKRIQSSI